MQTALRVEKMKSSLPLLWAAPLILLTPFCTTDTEMETYMCFNIITNFPKCCHAVDTTGVACSWKRCKDNAVFGRPPMPSSRILCTPGMKVRLEGPAGHYSPECKCEWCHKVTDASRCEWYEECLNLVHPCDEEETHYALEYGKHFCNLYNERMNAFTQEGQQWIQAVRTCLQNELKPLLNKSPGSVSCEHIKEQAFASHTPCYLNPGHGTPSICDLKRRDWAQAFWTIKGAVGSHATESLRGMWDVTVGCGLVWPLFELPFPLGLAKIVVQFIKDSRSIRAAETTTIQDDVMALNVTAEIAAQLKWDKETTDWFSYAAHAEDDRLTIDVLLGDKVALNLTTATEGEGVGGMARSLVKAVESGLLNGLRVDGKGVDVQRVDVCCDPKCETKCDFTCDGFPRSEDGEGEFRCGEEAPDGDGGGSGGDVTSAFNNLLLVLSVVVLNVNMRKIV